MKPNSPLSKLPSLHELLKHPTVLGVVERVNQTTIAQRATGFWEELQASWKEQGGAPSVAELAQRLAQRLLGRSSHAIPLVNATGLICSQHWQAPLAEAAVHEVVRFASDYQQPSTDLLEQVAASLVKLTGAQAAWVATSYDAAISIASQCAGATVFSSRVIGLLDPAEFGKESVDTISDRLEAGADLVVLDGAGLLGGPRCGIVVGSSQILEAALQGELAGALTADGMVLAALQATLEIYRTADKVIHQIPVLQLLSTPLENLRQRCERLAPLLAECSAVASAEATECESNWLDTGSTQRADASWAIALCPASGATQGSLEELAKRFELATPQVIGRTQEERFLLDFRALFPRWDQGVVGALDS